MAASLRNFFITFILALLLFGGLAYAYYGDLEAVLPTPSNGTNVSGENSGTSDIPSRPTIVVSDDEGDDLGVINGLIVTKNTKGEVTRVKFLRINSNNRRIITCELSLQASLYNKVGALMPLSDYLRLYPVGKATQAISALTGYAADFYLVITPDTVTTMAENLGDLSLPLRQTIRYTNPIYEGYTFEEGDLLPQDYYLSIEAGTNLFAADTLSVIFGSYANAYEKAHGSSPNAGSNVTVQGPAPDALLEEMYAYLLPQLSGSHKEALKADTDRLSRALSGGETNLTPTYLADHRELLFKYGEENYRMVEIPYTTRDATLTGIKQEGE